MLPCAAGLFWALFASFAFLERVAFLARFTPLRGLLVFAYGEHAEANEHPSHRREHDRRPRRIEPRLERDRTALCAGDAAGCINDSTYTAMVAGMADATNVTHTPTVRINGQDYELSTPDALVARIKEIVGDIPGIDAPVPTPTPSPTPPH